MHNTKSEATVVHSEIFDKVAKGSRVALIYHLRIQDKTAYSNWYRKSSQLLEGMGGSRLFCIFADPVPREGMSVDEIVIDEYPSTDIALKFVGAIQTELTDSCNVTVLALQPDSPWIFRFVRIVARLMHFFKGINDSGTPTANWEADNTTVWPDDNQMEVAREQDLDSPMLVYNLNKNKEVAQYQGPYTDSKPCSGEEAYERYSKIAGVQLLRRGAYPVYGGKPLGLLVGGGENMLSDNWSKFILVYYPQRRNLLAMIEGEEFKRGQYHRDAGLERVAIFMGNDKTSDTS